MKKRGIICLIIAMVFALLPGAVYAQSAQPPDPGPEWNITLEFRYTKGEESKLNVPDSISRYGRNYHLVSKADPVLEKKLPATRVYTWLINGTISESERHLLDGMDDVELIPTTVEIGIVDDVTVKEVYPTNDVEYISITRSIDGALYTRAAVRFDVNGLDEFDLPVSYTAEIIYRGIKMYSGPGYEVKATYSAKENLDGVPQYVVVATYAPDGLTSSGGAGGTGGGGGTGTGGTVSPEPEVQPDSAVEPPVDQAVIDITEEPVPQSPGGTDTSAGPKPWQIALIIIAAVLGGVVLWMFLTRRKMMREKEILREEKRKAHLRSHGLVEYD